MAAAQKTNKCVCYTNSCSHSSGGTCYVSTCTEYKSGCLPGCKGCEKMKCQDGKPCKCCTPLCGCQKDCYEDCSDNNCKGLDKNCERCKKKCERGKACICYRCSCGTQCNGFLCACCYYCNPGKCQSKGTCDGYVLGKCPEGMCKGHGTYDDDGRPVYVENCTCNNERIDFSCQCYKSKYDNKCRCIRGEPDGHGNCVAKCYMCGKLCSQHSYIHEGTIVVASLAVAMIIIIVCSRYRDKIRRVFYELSGSISRAPQLSSAYTNNLVGDKFPEEMNIDRYPAFRPMPYAGLA
ncbi:hypothetical protein BBBOND_0400070 [Babesia bigemina]|uniref:Uncharacterized protein n=1 Tax=Babesia bigemina TaxID=5866 RepID=A0A061D9X1_BABBI|nr:hypothetical protein BBBOND_0400070 [Babesia bigemina]CDR97511.1 hypothetical protein BBBOND_0400070 [Babesia bigemina]|eukprot:XP_012769697.1 hypothetical protein BBBOND_0400070 [Babesia bigemina]